MTGSIEALRRERAGLAGYNALSAQLDLLSVDGAGQEGWAGYLVGDATSGAGRATVSYGTVFEPKKRHFVQAVLNRGSDIEIRGEKIPMCIVQVDLDIDSDNNAGFQADGIHNDPASDLLEDQAEDYPGAPGKIIRPNLLDVDSDKVPGFADGIDLYGNAGENASAPFVPMLLKIAGDIDQAKVRIRFKYSASDPAQVKREGDQTTGFTYLPAPGTDTDPGALRLWTKDGRQSRKVASVKDGGDYIKPNETYTLGELGTKTEKGVWRFFVEGVKPNIGTAHNLIKVEIDLEGNDAYQEADAVRATAIAAFLVPDYNHNREIDEEDIRRAEKGDTYYFWINDDDDNGETEGDDIPKQKGWLTSARDCDNDRVDGVRDLIDFFPVALDLKPLLEAFPPEQYRYGLRTAAENVNVVFPDLDQGTAGNYLTEVESARIIGELPSYPIKSGGISARYGMTSSTDAVNAFNAMLQRLLEQGTIGVLLLEGSAMGKEPLVLDVKGSGGQEVFTATLNLSLDGVEQMFRHKNLISPLRELYRDRYQREGLPDHDPVPNAGMPDRFEVGGALHGFQNSAHFSGFDAESDENNFVHVHGYNVNDQDARGEQTETFKRLYWSGSRAKFWGITWYGWESQKAYIPTIGQRSPNYHVNVRHAFNAGSLLKNFTNQYILENVTIFAHSLGNIVVSSAIREGININRFLMVNPAVAEEAYTPEDVYAADSAWQDATRYSMYHPEWRYPDGIAVPLERGYQPFLWASEWYKLFRDTPGDDRSRLTWRNLFAPVRNKATYVYYTPTDEAFRPFNYSLESVVSSKKYPTNLNDRPGLEDVIQNWSLTDGSKLGTYSWALQELFKGRIWLDKDSDYGGWGFNLDDDSYWRYEDPVNPKKLPIYSSYANVIPKDQLRCRPFFSKNSDYNIIYTDQPPKISASLQEELLANEFPALTFAVGHGGVKEFEGSGEERNIDIRQEYAVGKPWPQDRINGYDWRHSDVYAVAYPYLYLLYDSFVRKIKGE